jgi:hypothetical protein
MTLDEIVDELVPVSNVLMDEWIDGTDEDPDFQWPNQIFKVERGRGWKERFRSKARGEKWPEWKENEPTPLTQFGRVSYAEVRPTIFKQGFIVTDLRMEYGMGDLYELSTYINSMEEWTDEFMRGGFLRLPEMAAGVFLNAFSSAAQPMRDGTALIANSHTDVPGDNLTTTKISTQLLDEFDTMRVGKFSDNSPRFWRWDTIIYGPKNANKIQQLLGSQQMPGGNDNDINPWYGRYRNRIELPYLDDQYQSGASDYIFVLDSRMHNLYGRLHELPNFRNPFQVDTETWKFEARTIFTYFALNNAGIAGSLGTVTPS